MTNDSSAEDVKLSDEEIAAADLGEVEIEADSATPEQVEALLKSAKTLHAQKKHWREKAVDPETGKTYKTLYAEARASTSPTNAPPAAPVAVTEKTDERLQKLELSEEKRQFGHRKELSPEETDALFAFAKGMGMTPAEAMEQPFYKQGLAAMRQQAKVDGAIPGPSARVPKVEGKTFAEMKPEERSKNFSAIVEAAGRK